MLTHVVKNGSTTLYSQTVARDQQLKGICLRVTATARHARLGNKATVRQARLRVTATARQACLRFGLPSSTTVSESRPYQSTSCCANCSGNLSQRADAARSRGDGCPVRGTRRAKRSGRPVGRGARQYDAFGQFVLPSHPSTLTFGFTWKGYFYDADVELYYLGYRFYSPKTGRLVRFTRGARSCRPAGSELTRDPTRLRKYATARHVSEAGGLNLYAHVRGDAINHYDILGLSSDDAGIRYLKLTLTGFSFTAGVSRTDHPYDFASGSLSINLLVDVTNISQGRFGTAFMNSGVEVTSSSGALRGGGAAYSAGYKGGYEISSYQSPLESAWGEESVSEVTEFLCSWVPGWKKLIPLVVGGSLETSKSSYGLSGEIKAKAHAGISFYSANGEMHNTTARIVFGDIFMGGFRQRLESSTNSRGNTHESDVIVLPVFEVNEYVDTHAAVAKNGGNRASHGSNMIRIAGGTSITDTDEIAAVLGSLPGFDPIAYGMKVRKEFMDLNAQ